MADTIDTRLRHLRSRTPLNVKAHSERRRKPGARPAIRRPGTLDCRDGRVNAGSAEGRFCLAWVPQAFSPVLLRWPRPLR